MPVAEADFVGQQEPSPRAGDDAVGGEDLVRQDLGAGVAELAALVAGEEPRRLHLQLEPPRLFPFAARRPLQRRLDALHFGEVEDLVLRAVGRRHEDGGVELHLGLVGAHLHDAADAIGLVHGVRAADAGAFGEGRRSIGLFTRGPLCRVLAHRIGPHAFQTPGVGGQPSGQWP
jgi:hypothetical protein